MAQQIEELRKNIGKRRRVLYLMRKITRMQRLTENVLETIVITRKFVMEISILSIRCTMC